MTRILLVAAVVLAFYFYKSSSSSSNSLNEIQRQNVLELVSRAGGKLDARKHKFLQSRMWRDERDDMMNDIVRNGADDYWERFQKP